MTVPNPPGSDPWAVPAPPTSGDGAGQSDQPPTPQMPSYQGASYESPGYAAPSYQVHPNQAPSYPAPTYPGSPSQVGYPTGDFPGPGALTGGYGAAPSPGTNPWAIASLVSSLLCLVPVGLVTGIVALVQLRTRLQAGKGLAIAGIVISTLVTVVGLIGLTLSVVAGREFADSGFFEPPREDTAAAVQGLDVGDCYTYGSGAITPVDCATYHDGELFLTGTLGLPDDSRPLDLVLLEADDHCYSEFERYVGAPYEESDHEYHLYAPDETSWDAGDRAFACTVVSWDQAPMTGSVRGSGS